MTAFATPFAKELRTNYVPSLQDRNDIQKLLVEPQMRLKDVNDKILEVEQILDNLKRERDTLDDEIQEHTRLLTPCRSLPDDILREIFAHASNVPEEIQAIMSPAEAPLLLGLVCSRWRSLAYNTPSLWAALYIPPPTPISHPPPNIDETRLLITEHQEKLRKHQIAVTDWLLRSGACPLSISFSCLEHFERTTRGIDNGILRAVQSYIDILLSFSHRWHTLHLFIPPGDLFNRIASIPSASIPNIKCLQLQFSHYVSATDSATWSSSNLLNMTSLQALAFPFLPFRPKSIPSHTLSHLSHLSLGSNISSRSPIRVRHTITLEEAYIIFSSCQRLVHCSMYISDLSEVPNPSAFINISLPFLNSLVIVEHSCEFMATLFECLADLSELRKVVYYTAHPPSNQRKSPLITLIARTNNQLSFLAIDFRYYTLDDLRTIFGFVPNLTQLIVNNRVSRNTNPNLPTSFNIAKVSLDLLTPFSNGETYCPRLHTLYFKKPQNLGAEDVLSFLQRRMSASRRPDANIEPLRQVHVSLTQPAESDLPPQLLEYVKTGQLTLNIPPSPPLPVYSRAKINPYARTLDLVQNWHNRYRWEAHTI